MTLKKVQALHPQTKEPISIRTMAEHVEFEDGRNLKQIIGDVESDMFSPTITQNTSVGQLGRDSNVDVSANVQDGAFKSAILFGNTLVNMLKDKSEIRLSSDGGHSVVNVLPIVKSKDYWLQFNITQTNTRKLIIIQEYAGGVWKRNVDLRHDIGLNKIKYTTGTDVDEIKLFNPSSFGGEEVVLGSIMMFDVDITTLNIPYFTGMTSSKMPVLTTFGKNLLDERWELGKFSWGTGNKVDDSTRIRTVEKVKVTPGKKIYFTKPNVENDVVCYDEKRNFIKAEWMSASTNVYEVPSNCNFINVSPLTLDDSFNYQIEYGTVKSSHEDYKTNILSCLEEVELGKVGDVGDTLNLLNGLAELHNNKITIDGNQKINDVTELANCLRIRFNINGILVPKNAKVDIIKCDKYKVALHDNMRDDVEQIGVDAWTGIIYLNIEKSKLSDFTVNGVKSYLTLNSFDMVYRRSEKVVKTVDLSGTLFGYKGGHIEISNGFEGNMSYNDGFTFPYEVNVTKITDLKGVEIDITGMTGNGSNIIVVPTCVNGKTYVVSCTPVQSLLPTLEYSVPTSRGGQITQNTSTIMKHDKKLYSLEMMLMSSLITSDYERLLLTYDIELTKSTNQESKSPLRYHMLSRLIEEKMYEEANMLAKLDVFLLYNEITFDEYLELSDIVLGVNNDIVEEV